MKNIKTAQSINYNDEYVNQLRSELDEKVMEIVRLEGQLKAAVDLKLNADKEITGIKKKLAEIDSNKEYYDTIIQRKDEAYEDLLLQKKIVEQDLSNKTRLLKERQELSSKMYVNTALENQKRIYVAEIENRNLKIEMLEQNLKSAEDRLKITQLPPQMNQSASLTGNMMNTDHIPTLSDKNMMTGKMRTQTNFFPIQDVTVEEMRHKIVSLESKLKERGEYRERDDGADRGGKDYTVSSLLVQGYVKENKRLMEENNNLKSLFAGKQKSVSNTNPVSSDEFAEHLETIKRLQAELARKDESHRKKEEQMKNKVDRCDVLEKYKVEKDSEIAKLRKDLEKAVGELKTAQSDCKIKDIDIKTIKVQLEQAERELEEANRVLRE